MAFVDHLLELVQNGAVVLLLIPPALRNFVRVLTQIEAVDHSDGLYGILSTKEGPGPMYLV